MTVPDLCVRPLCPLLLLQMVPIQPVNLQKYLCRTATRIPKNIAHYFYISWEDALWDLLKHFKIQQEAKILLPDFFCRDVEKNMKRHGLECIWYKVDKNFQTPEKIFKQHLEKHKPKIIIIFHAAGITNQLLKKTAWLKALSQNAILIEDCVHRIVNPKKIKFIVSRHVIIDSVRKVTPLMGSNLYANAKIKIQQTPWWHTIFYQFRVTIWWAIFQCCLISVTKTKSKKWKIKWNKLAEKAMLKGYDIIGDNKKAGALSKTFSKILQRFSTRIDHKNIQNIKERQVKKYLKKLKPIWKNKKIFQIKFPKIDFKNLRGLPIGLKNAHADSILQKIRQRGLLIRFELEDSAWSQKQKVIYLPLGPHISLTEIEKIAKTFKNTLEIDETAYMKSSKV